MPTKYEVTKIGNILINYGNSLKTFLGQKIWLDGQKSLTLACLKEDFLKVYESLDSLHTLTSLEEAQTQFKHVMSDRYKIAQETLLSPFEQPLNLTNEFCFELFQCLFKDAGVFEYLQIMAPTVKTLLMVETKHENLHLKTTIKEVPFRKENIALFCDERELKKFRKELMVCGTQALWLPAVTRHHDIIENKPRIIQFRHQIYSDLEHALKAYPNVRSLLFRHPQIEALFGNVARLNREGQTLRDAIMVLKNGLELSGTRHTGREEVGTTAFHALEQFYKYLNLFSLDDRKHLLSEVKSTTLTLGQILESFVKKDDQCVEQGAELLGVCLEIPANNAWLKRSPLLSENQKIKLKQEIHEFWKSTESFDWVLEKGNLPKAFIHEAFSKIGFNNKKTLITILTSFQNFDVYLEITSNPKVIALCKRKDILSEIIVNLTGEQQQLFLKALKQHQKLSEVIGDLNTVLDLKKLMLSDTTIEILYQLLRDDLPQWTQNKMDFLILYKQLPKDELKIFWKNIKPHLNRILDGDVVEFYMLTGCLYPPERSIVFHAIKQHLPSYVKKGEHIQQILVVLNDDDSAEATRILKAEIINHMKSAKDFAATAAYLNLKQVTAIYEIIKNKLPILIKTASDFLIAIELLDDKERTEVFEACKDNLPNLINRIIELQNIVQRLNPQQRNIVFSLIQDKIPQLINTNASALYNFLSIFEQDKCIKVLRRVMSSDLMHDIKELFHNIFRFLEDDKCEKIFETFKEHWAKIIKTPEDFQVAVQWLNPTKMKSFCQCLREQMPKMISKKEHFTMFLSVLIEDERRLFIANFYKNFLTKSQLNRHDVDLLVNITKENATELNANAFLQKYVADFEIQYKALRDQRYFRFFRTNVIPSMTGRTVAEKFQFILEHTQQRPSSRTATAFTALSVSLKN